MEQYKEIARGKLFIYYACSRGFVLRVLKSTYDEQKVKVWYRRGAAYVKINQKNIPLKKVIAAAFLKDYKKGIIVETVNGNPFDCRVENLQLISKQEHGKRTGGRGNNTPVRVIFPNGQERDFPSMRSAAKALFVSYQTVINKANEKYKNTVLNGYQILTLSEDNI